MNVRVKQAVEGVQAVLAASLKSVQGAIASLLEIQADLETRHTKSSFQKAQALFQEGWRRVVYGYTDSDRDLVQDVHVDSLFWRGWLVSGGEDNESCHTDVLGLPDDLEGSEVVEYLLHLTDESEVGLPEAWQYAHDRTEALIQETKAKVEERFSTEARLEAEVDPRTSTLQVRIAIHNQLRGQRSLWTAKDAREELHELRNQIRSDRRLPWRKVRFRG